MAFSREIVFLNNQILIFRPGAGPKIGLKVIIHAVD